MHIPARNTASHLPTKALHIPDLILNTKHLTRPLHGEHPWLALACRKRPKGAWDQEVGAIGKCISFAAHSLKQNRTDMSDIKSRVIAIIVDKLGVDQNEVTPEASFTNDLGADSLDTVELIMEFEKEFNIAIPDDQAEKIQTVGNAVEYVEKNAK
jgi:acyl carrier protein